MTKRNTSRAFILSAHLNELGEVRNSSRHEALVAHLESAGVAFVECAGRYAGTFEDSCIVVGFADELVAGLAAEFGQECYLAISENDRSTFEVCTATGYHRGLGKLRSVGPRRPREGSYTVRDGWYYQADGVNAVDLPEGF